MRVSSLRWTVLTIAFAVLTYGSWVGVSLGDFLPAFSCIYVGQSRGGDCFLWHVQHHLSGHGGPGFLVRLSEPVLLYFFLLVIVLGKAWCGWICPLGFIMDVLDLVRRKLNLGYLFFSKKLRGFLAPVKWVLLFISLVIPLACLPFFIRSRFAMDLAQPYCQLCPARYVAPICVGNFGQIAINFRSRTTLVMSVLGMVITGLFLVGSFTKRRFWCAFCPLGLVIGLCRKISFLKLKKDCQACTRCGICYQVCPLEIEEVYTEREQANVTCQDCIMCMRCVDNCPENDALRATFCGKTVYRSTHEGFFSRQGALGPEAQEQSAADVTKEQNDETGLSPVGTTPGLQRGDTH